MKWILPLSIAVLLLSACSKKDGGSTPTPEDPNTVFPNYVKSDSAGEYFIQATFNGKKICMSPQQNPVDTFFNAYYFYESVDQDQLNLIRSNTEGSAEMQIYFGEARMLTRPIPYKLPHDNLALCEFTCFQFCDKWHRHGTQNDQYDDYTYQGSTNTGMKLIVTSFTNEIIEGTFEGGLRTNTGKYLKVTDGSFRIKMIVMTDDSK